MFNTPPAWRPLKLALKAWLLRWRSRYVQTFRSYDAQALTAALRKVGVRAGDSVMLHSSFSDHSGFRGGIEPFTQTLIDGLGPEGHLLMVSLPYRSASWQYLEQRKRFDVRKTPSMMGMVSELFRRRPDVLRSLHPTHPVLVRGPQAQWFVAGHEECLYPCGPGTPFDRLVERDGMVMFFNAPLTTFTFFHYLEHLVAADLPFSIYTDQPYAAQVIDRDGRERTVHTYAFAPQAIARRRFDLLEQALRSRGLVAQCRVGNSLIEAVRVRQVIELTRQMQRERRLFYDTASSANNAHPNEGPAPG